MRTRCQPLPCFFSQPIRDVITFNLFVHKQRIPCRQFASANKFFRYKLIEKFLKTRFFKKTTKRIERIKYNGSVSAIGHPKVQYRITLAKISDNSELNKSKKKVINLYFSTVKKLLRLL